MVTPDTSSGFMEHRRWEDILAMILGAAILISPMFTQEAGNTVMVASTAIVGALIIILAGLEQLNLRRWEEILMLLAGLWVVVSPFVLQYGGPLRVWHVVLGAVVALLAILELWQDRRREMAT
jgi:hypothetical protein